MRTHSTVKLELSDKEYNMFKNLADYIENMPDDEFDELDESVQKLLSDIMFNCADIIVLASDEE